MKHFHLVLLTFLLGASTALFRAHELINWDAGQFALGTVHYSLSDHSPHPPGYFLFVMVGKFLNSFIHDINLSFIVLTAAAALAAILLFYFLVLEVTKSSATAFFSTLLLLLNPIVWYERSVPLTYIFEVLALVGISLCTFRLMRRVDAVSTLGAFVGYGLLTGFRPSIVLASFPLIVLNCWLLRKSLRLIFLGITGGVLATLAWFIPFAFLTGGIHSMLIATLHQAQSAHADFGFGYSRILFLLKTCLLTFNIFLVLLPLAWIASPDTRPTKNLLTVSLPPLLLIFCFYLFFHFGEVGYILALVPPVFLLALPLIQKLSTSKMGYILLGGIIVLQCFLFLTPQEWLRDRALSKTNASTIRLHDERIATYVRTVKKYSPEKTVIFVVRGQYLDEHNMVRSYPFDDIRSLAYLLPEYTLYDVQGVRGLYLVAHNYRESSVNSSTITVPASATTLVILADYLHPHVYPAGISLHGAYNHTSPFNIYTADITANKNFQFLGFTTEKGVVNDH